jgi:hypothetical protein
MTVRRPLPQCAWPTFRLKPWGQLAGVVEIGPRRHLADRLVPHPTTRGCLRSVAKCGEGQEGFEDRPDVGGMMGQMMARELLGRAPGLQR